MSKAAGRLCGLIMIILVMTACSGNDPKEVERTIAGEDESISVAKDFIADILAYNETHNKDLTEIGEYTAFWAYLKEAGLTAQLSGAILDANHYGDEEWQIIDSFYVKQLKPLIHYLYGYEQDDFRMTFGESLGNIDVHIKPEAMDKGIYLLNDPAETVFQLFVERVKGEGVRIVSVYTELPVVMNNKYEWIPKNLFADYVQQVKNQAAEAERLLEQERQEEAALAALEAEQEAAWEAEQQTLKEEQEAQALWQEQAALNEETCSRELVYEDAWARFDYGGCILVTGSLETDKMLTIIGDDNEYDLLSAPFSVTIAVEDNADGIAFADYPYEQYDFEYATLFGENGFVGNMETNPEGETTEYYEGVIADGSAIASITFTYIGDTRPYAADNLLFGSLRFK